MEETDKFLETYNLSSVNQEETVNLNWLITTKKIESILKIFQWEERPIIAVEEEILEMSPEKYNWTTAIQKGKPWVAQSQMGDPHIAKKHVKVREKEVREDNRKGAEWRWDCRSWPRVGRGKSKVAARGDYLKSNMIPGRLVSEKWQEERCE